MKQTANIIPGSYSRREPLKISCMRDGAHVMTLKCTSQRDAETIKNEWAMGANMARMAELMQNLGLKI